MTQSALMQERFAKRLVLRRIAAMFYLASALAYIVWRATIINEQALFLSGMYYLSDIIAILLGAVTIFASWNYRHRRSPSVPDGLSVDVLVPTYREPVDMVRRTLEAAKAIRYPHETWLLDDGNRPAMRELAAELGCRYLARSDNHGAKAGNLNHALTQSTADFVAVFDADHIPQTHALDAMLGFFSDPKVAMVQTPQDYYNVDALQYMNPKRGGGLWHDQSFFYNLSQPGRDYYNAASCAGTSVVYRRSALDSIGGIPTETVTEDVHTSLKLQKAGYTIPYLNEPVAYGVAAADLADYYRTRLRYGHGNIHALRRENILWSRGLTFRQRLSYLFLGLIYLEGWQQLMVFLVPTIALIFGIAPFEITILNVLIVLLYPLLSYLLMQEVGCGFSRYWTAEIYSMMRFPVHLLATLGLFRNRLVWRSSQKNVEGRFNPRLLIPQILVLIISLVAVVVGFYRLNGEYTPGPLIAAVVDRLPDRETIDGGVTLVADFFETTGEQVVALVYPPESVVTTGSEGGDAVVAPPSVEPPITAPAGEVPTTQPIVRPERQSPPPIDWFEPLTKGYTIDLVLIAGFWAIFNALRVLFVIVKVAANARLTHSDYLFRTTVPVRIETSGGPRYAVAERLSTSKAVIVGSLGGLREEDLSKNLAATAYLPTGAAHITLQPEEDGWRPGARTRSASFEIRGITESDRKILENGLYTTSWHRECLNNDAEFTTPLGALARAFGGKGVDRSPAKAALVFDGEADEPHVALLKRDGELLMLAAEEPQGGVARVLVIDRNGSEMRSLLLRKLVANEPLHTSVPDAQRMLRYATEVSADSSNVAVLRHDSERLRAVTPVAIATAKVDDRATAV